MIPRRIDILKGITSYPSSSINLEILEMIEFEKLGYIQFAENSQNNYSARELKTVHTNTDAQLIKFIVHNNYPNNYNLFNQVGIISLSFYNENNDLIPGNIVINNNKIYENEDEKSTPAKILRNPNYPENIPELIETELKQLQEAKQRAAENEDFDEAYKLKEIINRIINLKDRINELERRKIQAVREEDYLTAKQIKIEMDKLRKFIYSSDVQQPSPRVLNSIENQKLIHNEGRQYNHFTKNIKERKQDPNLSDYQDNLNEFHNEENEENQYPEEEEFEEEVNEQYAPGIFEDQVVPALLNKDKPREMMDEPPAIREPLEPLDRDCEKIADQYSFCLSENILQHLFSKYWYHRAEGINILISELQNNKFENIVSNDPEKIISGLISIAILMSNDKAIQVVLNSLTLINEVINYENLTFGENKKSLILEQSIEVLIKKLAESNIKVRKKSEELCLKIGNSKQMACDQILKIIINPIKIRQNNSVRNMIGKISVLIELIKNRGFHDENQIQEIVDYAVSGIKNPNSSVRNLSYQLIKEIYNIIGDQVFEYIIDLRPAQFEIIKAELRKVGLNPNSIIYQNENARNNNAYKKNISPKIASNHNDQKDQLLNEPTSGQMF